MLGAGLDDTAAEAPCPVLVADPAGRLTARNRAAARLFPAARPGSPLGEALPGWLRAAHARLLETAPDAPPPADPDRGPVGDRRFAAHPVRRPGGDVVWWLAEETELRAVERELAAERERTAFLARASTALLASLNVERCMELTARLAAEHLADAAVVVAPSAGWRFPVAFAGPGGWTELGDVRGDPVDMPGLSEALRGFPPVPSRWIDPAAVPGWLLPPRLAGMTGPVAVTPLPGHGVPAGALVLLREAGRGPFSADEEVFARLFAARAGTALSAARMYSEQAGITATLMRELLPPPLRGVPGVDLAGGYRPSGRDERVGGDFYDLHPAAEPDGETLVVLGDVCGKGLDAAVLTGKIRNTLHALRPLAGDHGRVLELLNDALLTSHHTRYATLVLASVSRRGAQVALRLTSAGHPAPLVVRADGSVEAARTRGTIVGALPRVRSDTAEVTLAPGETCLLFTDGITEAKGGPLGEDRFGEDRLRQVLAECAGMPAGAVVERVQMVASQWVGGRPHDDMAVVAVTAPRTTHLAAVNGHTRGRYTA
jgi:serine phosphatase RsbU (regulator of sigma subunit)